MKQAAISRRALAPVWMTQTGASALRLIGKFLNGALLIGIFVALGSGDILAGVVVGGLVVVISGDIRPSRRQ